MNQYEGGNEWWDPNQGPMRRLHVKGKGRPLGRWGSREVDWTSVWQPHHYASSELCTFACSMWEDSLACHLSRSPLCTDGFHHQKSGLWLRVRAGCKDLCRSPVRYKRHPLGLKSHKKAGKSCMPEEDWRGVEVGQRFTYFQALEHQNLHNNGQKGFSPENLLQHHWSSCLFNLRTRWNDVEKDWSHKAHQHWVWHTFYYLISMPQTTHTVCFLCKFPVQLIKEVGRAVTWSHVLFFLIFEMEPCSVHQAGV